MLALTSSKENQKIGDVEPINLRYQGYSSFYTRNYHHSQVCFEILNEKGKSKAKDCNLLAYMYARHNEKENAITTWCMALEKSKDNKIAKKALEYIRKQGRIINLMEDDFFDSIFPKEPFLIPFKLFGKLILIT